MTSQPAAELLGATGAGTIAATFSSLAPADAASPDFASASASAPAPGTESDESLLARFLKGEHPALGTLAERYEPLLLGLACGLTGRRELALEAVQETWLRVIKYGRSFRSGSTVRTWLYRILINCCKDVRGRAARMRLSPSDATGGAPPARPAGDGSEPPSIIGNSSDLATLRGAVDELSGDQKLLVLLCYHHGLTHSQAAQVLDIPVGTLKSRLNTILNTLRNACRDANPIAREHTP